MVFLGIHIIFQNSYFIEVDSPINFVVKVYERYDLTKSKNLFD